MYIENFVETLGIHKGEVLLLTGNLSNLLRKCLKENASFKLDLFINLLLAKLGNEGTLLLPTFTWDFCQGIPFNIKTSLSKVGILGNNALKREDFKRSKHPIYSFAVAGKHQTLFTSLDNVGSFDYNSPFAHMYLYQARMIILDVPLQNSFTFVHHVEEMEKVFYRYSKTFQGEYTDDEENTSERSYTMYVRDLKHNVKTNLAPLEKLFLEKNTMLEYKIDNIHIKSISLAKAFHVIQSDIRNNEAKSLFTMDEGSVHA